MQNLLIRSLSALIYVAIFIFAVFFSPKTYISLIIFFAIVCLWELKKIINFKNVLPFFLLPISAYFFLEHLSHKRLLFFLIITLLSAIRLIYFVFKGNSEYPKILLDKFDVTIRYIIFPFCFLILLPFYQENYHPHIILYVLVLIWANDTFAYLTGRQFGKRKLLEKVSPKKTIEGFIGGCAFSIITGFLIGKFDTHTSFHYHWIIIAIIVSIFGTLGDLIESKFKRQAKVKDSGNIMPGHGGLLDRLDSLFFLAPFVYLYVHYLL